MQYSIDLTDPSALYTAVVLVLSGLEIVCDSHVFHRGWGKIFSFCLYMDQVYLWCRKNNWEEKPVEGLSYKNRLVPQTRWFYSEEGAQSKKPKFQSWNRHQCVMYLVLSFCALSGQIFSHSIIFALIWSVVQIQTDWNLFSWCFPRLDKEFNLCNSILGFTEHCIDWTFRLN